MGMAKPCEYRVPGEGQGTGWSRGPARRRQPCVSCMRVQVGPDDLTLNALLQLLVHLAKRDAFNILRTQQQVRHPPPALSGHPPAPCHVSAPSWHSAACLELPCWPPWLQLGYVVSLFNNHELGVHHVSPETVGPEHVRGGRHMNHIYIYIYIQR